MATAEAAQRKGQLQSAPRAGKTGVFTGAIRPDSRGMARRSSCPERVWVLLVAALIPIAQAEVHMTIGALGCAVLALPEHEMMGQTLQVAARAAAAGKRGEGACHPGHLRCAHTSCRELNLGSHCPLTPSHAPCCRLMGLESGGFGAPACRNSTVVQAGLGEAGAISALDGGLPAGAAYLTLESSCHQPAVVTLTFSSESSSSGSIGPWSRKLLQQGSDDSARPPRAPLPHQQPADNSSSADSSGGDKYNPYAPQQLDLGSGADGAGNGTDGSGSGSSSSGNATGGSTATELACCCRNQTKPLPYHQPDIYIGSMCCCGTKKRERGLGRRAATAATLACPCWPAFSSLFVYLRSNRPDLQTNPSAAV